MEKSALNSEKIPVFFHPDQLFHRPMYEWAFGEKIEHPESTSRAERILSVLLNDPHYQVLEPKPALRKSILELHDRRLLQLYKLAESKLRTGKTFSPSVFPIRSKTIPNPNLIEQAGYFCLDSGTPLAQTTLSAALLSAGCAQTAARVVLNLNAPFSYALSRPPGHHADENLFGGYCYLNNAAMAAKLFRAKGKVALIDIDFHHGNGTQNLFYSDPNVFFVSIHGDPKHFYPYFFGHAHETGKGAGKGFNLNLPLPEGCDFQEYKKVLIYKAIHAIQKFNPKSLVISAGFDTYKKDPIGRFELNTPDYFIIGELLGRLRLPTAIIQEGGYCTKALGFNVDAFLKGFQSGHQSTRTNRRRS